MWKSSWYDNGCRVLDSVDNRTLAAIELFWTDRDIFSKVLDTNGEVNV